MKVRGQRIIPPKERIMGKSSPDSETGCWNWTGAVRPPRNYGVLVVGSRTTERRSVGAHRYSYETFVGPIPEGLCVCHRCDNPRCVNPDHLFLGTAKDNADDRDAKGRGKPATPLTGEASPNAVLTDTQIVEIRANALSSQKVAQLYGVSSGYIRQLRRGLYRPSPPE